MESFDGSIPISNCDAFLSGKAAMRLKSGYGIAKGLGHRIIPPVPALVQLHSNKKALKALSGVRVRASVLLSVEARGEGSFHYREQGEVLFADYGISGIPVMQVSRFAARELAKGEKAKAVVFYTVQKMPCKNILLPGCTGNITGLSGESLESGLTKNLYVVGELADIDGTCGGYNLHWAFMSGFAAAEGILAKMGKTGI